MLFPIVLLEKTIISLVMIANNGCIQCRIFLKFTTVPSFAKSQKSLGLKPV